MTTSPRANKSLSNSPISRNYAVSRTKEFLREGVRDGEDYLVQPPPTVHPEKLIPEIIANHGPSAVYIAPTKAQLARVKQACKNEGLSTRRISSGYDQCPSFTGSHGEKTENQLKSTVEDVPLGLLHKTQNLPCCPGCPFTSWKRPDFTEDVILANPRHAYIDDLLEDRAVFTCSLRGDSYIDKIENPSDALGPFLRENTQFSGYADFIQNRDSGRAPSIWDYVDRTIDPSTPDEEFGYDIDTKGHHMAPLIAFGLLHAEELDNGWETTYHTRDLHGCSIYTNRFFREPC